MKDILEKLAIQSSSGDLYVRMAEIYLSEKEYGQAFGAINRGLDKGNLSEPNTAHELYTEIGKLLGISGFKTLEDALADLKLS